MGVECGGGHLLEQGHLLVLIQCCADKIYNCLNNVQFYISVKKVCLNIKAVALQSGSTLELRSSRFSLTRILAVFTPKRGAVVEWLEQLGYGAESRRIA